MHRVDAGLQPSDLVDADRIVKLPLRIRVCQRRADGEEVLLNLRQPTVRIGFRITRQGDADQGRSTRRRRRKRRSGGSLLLTRPGPSNPVRPSSPVFV